MLNRRPGPDRPGNAGDLPRHGSDGDLRSRLDNLPGWHPSSPAYQGETATADTPGPATETTDRASEPETGSGPSRWDSPGLLARADRPSPADIRLNADRREHILDGDATGGGHRHGTGRPGKTEFPAHWDDDTITGAVLSVARSPDQAPVRQNWNQRWSVRGTRDSVEIVAIVTPDGQIWTAWPREGSPGVIKNPHQEG